jgi:hypothetical protein
MKWGAHDDGEEKQVDDDQDFINQRRSHYSGGLEFSRAEGISRIDQGVNAETSISRPASTIFLLLISTMRITAMLLRWEVY